MKKRVLSLILALVMVLALVPATAVAADDTHAEAARCLYELGLFQGVGTNADGTPDFALDRAPTRAEAVTMLVRLLGKEAEAKAGTWETPFTDVADWAKPYVGYAYNNKLTTGTSATTFGGDITVNATQYLTMVLRALGYSDKWEDDFQWDAAWGKADKVGLTHGEYNADTTSFTRGDVAAISKSALTTPRLWKPESEQFFYVLFEEGVITPAQVKAAKLDVPRMMDTIRYDYIRIGEKRYRIFYAWKEQDRFFLFHGTYMQDRYTGTVCQSVYGLAIWNMLLDGKYEIRSTDSAFLDGEICFPVAGAPYTKEETVRREVSLGKYECDHKVTAFGKEICWTTESEDFWESQAKMSEAMGLELMDAAGGYDIEDLLDYFEITDPVIREKLTNPKIEEIDSNTFLVID